MIGYGIRPRPPYQPDFLHYPEPRHNDDRLVRNPICQSDDAPEKHQKRFSRATTSGIVPRCCECTHRFHAHLQIRTHYLDTALISLHDIHTRTELLFPERSSGTQKYRARDICRASGRFRDIFQNLGLYIVSFNSIIPLPCHTNNSVT